MKGKKDTVVPWTAFYADAAWHVGRKRIGGIQGRRVFEGRLASAPLGPLILSPFVEAMSFEGLRLPPRLEVGIVPSWAFAALGLWQPYLLWYPVGRG